MRFRPEQHLRRQSDFLAVREKGRRLNCGAFLLSYVAREPASAVRRVGFVASTSAVGGAVERNRARRRLRALFRQHQAALPPGIDLVIVARAAVNRLPFAELAQKFTAACRQLAPAADA
ncbi:MAG: ribonuclease P protein component [Verrucomicrobia bacterium]|nr:ribonuclease P protein component [Verrucomicrobiota bacterium]